jgi:hypothetical protein
MTMSFAPKAINVAQLRRLKGDNNTELLAELPEEIHYGISRYRQPAGAIKEKIDAIPVADVGQMLMKYGKHISGYLGFQTPSVTRYVNDNLRAPLFLHGSKQSQPVCPTHGVPSVQSGMEYRGSLYVPVSSD